ncbi:hypothetical protein WMY93_020705 [Mugilogobius chulae]|uniref:Uncharacterized protein n=1 Tax=Mugilogobius chulae TaxID=88201 RepID=A0AAW0NA66_9GOBI
MFVKLSLSLRLDRRDSASTVSLRLDRRDSASTVSLRLDQETLLLPCLCVWTEEETLLLLCLCVWTEEETLLLPCLWRLDEEETLLLLCLGLDRRDSASTVSLASGPEETLLLFSASGPKRLLLSTFCVWTERDSASSCVSASWTEETLLLLVPSGTEETLLLKLVSLASGPRDSASTVSLRLDEETLLLLVGRTKRLCFYCVSASGPRDSASTVSLRLDRRDSASTALRDCSTASGPKRLCFYVSGWKGALLRLDRRDSASTVSLRLDQEICFRFALDEETLLLLCLCVWTEETLLLLCLCVWTEETLLLRVSASGPKRLCFCCVSASGPRRLCFYRVSASGPKRSASTVSLQLCFYVSLGLDGRDSAFYCVLASDEENMVLLCLWSGPRRSAFAVSCVGRKRICSLCLVWRRNETLASTCSASGRRDLLGAVSLVGWRLLFYCVWTKRLVYALDRRDLASAVFLRLDEETCFTCVLHLDEETCSSCVLDEDSASTVVSCVWTKSLLLRVSGSGEGLCFTVSLRLDRKRLLILLCSALDRRDLLLCVSASGRRDSCFYPLFSGVWTERDSASLCLLALDKRLRSYVFWASGRRNESASVWSWRFWTRRDLLLLWVWTEEICFLILLSCAGSGRRLCFYVSLRLDRRDWLATVFCVGRRDLLYVSLASGPEETKAQSQDGSIERQELRRQKRDDEMLDLREEMQMMVRRRIGEVEIE